MNILSQQWQQKKVLFFHFSRHHYFCSPPFGTYIFKEQVHFISLNNHFAHFTVPNHYGLFNPLPNESCLFFLSPCRGEFKFKDCEWIEREHDALC